METIRSENISDPLESVAFAFTFAFAFIFAFDREIRAEVDTHLLTQAKAPSHHTYTHTAHTHSSSTIFAYSEFHNSWNWKHLSVVVSMPIEVIFRWKRRKHFGQLLDYFTFCLYSRGYQREANKRKKERRKSHKINTIWTTHTNVSLVWRLKVVIFSRYTVQTHSRSLVNSHSPCCIGLFGEMVIQKGTACTSTHSHIRSLQLRTPKTSG